jgi:hypothetical protein
MATNTQEEFPHKSSPSWPKEFTRRRYFQRKSANQPYLEFLIQCHEITDVFIANGEGDDECHSNSGDEAEVEQHRDANWTDYREGETCNDHRNVRIFMTGTDISQDTLLSVDQVEKVAGFCEQAGFRDDRNDSWAILLKPKHRPPCLGPLTSQRLFEELSKEVAPNINRIKVSRCLYTAQRFSVKSDENVTTNVFGELESDLERRVV